MPRQFLNSNYAKSWIKLMLVRHKETTATRGQSC
jgi:hypothetical protein